MRGQSATIFLRPQLIEAPQVAAASSGTMTNSARNSFAFLANKSNRCCCDAPTGGSHRCAAQHRQVTKNFLPHPHAEYAAVALRCKAPRGFVPAHSHDHRSCISRLLLPPVAETPLRHFRWFASHRPAPHRIERSILNHSLNRRHPSTEATSHRKQPRPPHHHDNAFIVSFSKKPGLAATAFRLFCNR